MTAVTQQHQHLMMYVDHMCFVLTPVTVLHFQVMKCLDKSSDLITYDEREYSDAKDTICQSFEFESFQLKYDANSSDDVIMIKVLIPVIPL